MVFSRIGVKPVAELAGSLRTQGAYAALALLIPGGNLIALSVWALRGRASASRHLRRTLAMAAAVAVALIYPAGA